MTIFSMIEENFGGWRWARFHDYEVTADTGKRIAMVFSEERAEHDFDGSREPWKVVMTIKSGELRKVEYRDEDGDVLARITGLDTDADLVRFYLDPGIYLGRELYDLILRDGAVFEGTGRNDFTTSRGDDIVRSNDGHMYAKDRGGADRYVGGDGYDQVSYDDWFWDDPAGVLQGIVADLAKGRVVGPDGLVDRLIGPIEGIRGTFLDDILRGNRLDNEFHGQRGADIINGRGGRDQVSYRNEDDRGGDGGVIVNLAKGFAIDSFGDRDKLVSIERAQGTDAKDVFIDGGGNFSFQGGGGNDKFQIRRGDDWMRGEDGADQFIFVGGKIGNNIIDDFDHSEGDTIRIKAASGPGDIDISQDGGDALIAFGTGQIRLAGYDSNAVDLFDHISY